MGKIPQWDKGRKRRCDICGFEYSENDGNLRKQRGIWVDKACWDTLTDFQRQNNIKKR
jgi:rubredoxin